MLNSLIILILGLIVGSFLNVVILRYNTGRSLGGRSGCFSCGKKLVWYELFPVASWLAQGGRCRGCKGKISWQYPLVELLTGVLFVLAYWKFSPDWWKIAFACISLAVLVVLTTYDWRHKIIPNFFVYLFVILGFAYCIFFGDFFSGLFGGIVLALIFASLWFFSKGRWLGFGDVKLVAGIGLFLGWRGGLSAIILAVWAGALVGLGLIFLRKIKLWHSKKSFTMKSELPFAPFLMLGFILSFIFNLNVF